MQTLDHGAGLTTPRASHQQRLLPAILVAISLLAPIGAPTPGVGLSSPAPARVATTGNGTVAPTPAPPAALVDYISDRWDIDEARAAEFVATATLAAEKESVDPLLVLAVVAKESAFTTMGNPGDFAVGSALRHVNPRYPHGPMQVAGRWHPDEMPRDARGNMRVTTTRENIEIGTRVLGRYLKREGGNVRRALLRYNGALSDAGSKYATRVMQFRRDLQRAALES